ncbi:MAG: TonB-dependent receptor [Sphingobium sp.]|nr:TonB-dependent receptor [Sphingobium sp.]
MASVAPLCAANAQTFDDLRKMSLDQLGDVDVSSVSKTPQPIGEAPAAVYVIGHDAIQRSGATTLPEALRLAPNLVVSRQNASQYVISARGMSGSPEAQNFANKLLVLIDGRSVYTPLYSGVYWDMQDVLLADVNRIEVISGPGATLWGANAVNGVINIITRSSADSQGVFVEATGGALERAGSLRYGGKLGESLTYRVYARGIQQDPTRTIADASGEDERWRVQGGFRLDWARSERDQFTLQGDRYVGRHGQFGTTDERIAGRNLLARWNRGTTAGANLQLQAYYDHTVRETFDGGGRFALDTYDLDAQHSAPLGSWNAVVVGGGLRANRYRIHGAAGLEFDPASRTLWHANAFVQDTVTVTPKLALTLGLKLEKNPFAGVTPLPSARLAWMPGRDILIWGAASRAIRSTTPFDRDVREYSGGTLFLTGSQDFVSEKLTAFELGTRFQPAKGLSVSITGFRHIYDDLRSIEPTSGAFLPLYWGNAIRGTSWGIDSWADWQATGWWKLSASLSFLHRDFRFGPGASALLGLTQLGSDPKHHATIRSSMDLGSGVTIDAGLRHVGPFPNPRLPPYLELDGRLGWQISNRLMLSVSGANLLHRYHQEYPGSAGNLIPRQIWAGLQWRW